LSEPEIVRLPGDPPSPYEAVNGYSRVLRAGPFAIVGGTTSITPDGVVLGETPYEQTVEILGKILHELSRVGASAGDVVEVRIYVTDMSRGEEVGRAHGEVFGEIRPVMSMVGVSGLYHPQMLVEIEATAYLGPGTGS
jgi:enamine deaminase RidA (YjgF/YER057c/UK114 family)